MEVRQPHALADAPPGRIEYTTSCGTIRVVLDSEACSYYVEAPFDTDPALIRRVLDGLVLPLGFELVPEGDCYPETTPEGKLRIPAWPVGTGYGWEYPDDDRGSVSVGIMGRVLTAAAVLTSISYIPNIVEVLTS